MQNRALSSTASGGLCFWLGWLFLRVLAHDPVDEGGPHSLAHVGGRSIVASQRPVYRACSRRCRDARRVGWYSCRWGWRLRHPRGRRE